MTQTRWTLIDVEQHEHAGDFLVTANDFGLAEPAFSVRKRTLRGGLQAGVDVVEIDNGRLRFTVLPTRGMGIWKGALGDLPLGWQSPVAGPVHPQFVPLAEPGGLGWLDGFDEWLVRCGLENNGAPEFDDRGRLQYPLHGRIANRPASRVELEVDPERELIRVTGIVDETRFLFRHLQLRTTISTHFGAAGLHVHDEVTNLAGTPSEVQLLYHINFGSPLLDAGSHVVAPVKTLTPRDARAAAGIDSWQSYGPPQAGFAEQVYLLELLADEAGQTRVLLKNSSGAQGATVAFDQRQLPCFTLWKNTGALQDGYVTGLEPATNYPNPRSYEGRQGRVVKLPPGANAQFELSLGIHANAQSVADAEQSIQRLQQAATPEVFRTPQRGWSAAAE